jgi:integrase
MAINKTDAGTYAVDFRDQFKRRIQKTFATPREAVNFEKDALSQVARREYVKPANETVKELAEKWHQRKVDAGSYSRATLEFWKNHIEGFIVPSIGSVKVVDVDVEKVETAAATWKLAPQTVNKVLTTLTAIFALGKRYKLIKDNPAADAERMKLATEDEDNVIVGRDEVYNKEELGKLLAATEPGSRERIALMIPCFTGVRIGEEIALSWPAIDLKGGKLNVRLSMADSDKGLEPIFKTPKSKSSRRQISLAQELVHELRVWKLKCPTSARDLVLATEEGKPMHRKAISKLLDAAIEKAEIKRLTHHGLRHTFASLLLADGADIAEVSHLLGHKNPGITLRIYSHFVRRETKSVQNLASSILAGGQV